MTNLKEFKQELQGLKDTDRLHKYVISDILSNSKEYAGEYIERLKSRCEDVAQGCETGIVTSLINYTDTVNFYNKFRDEINNVLKEIQFFCEGETIAKILDGDFLIMKDKTKNKLAWLSYEEVNYKVLRLIEDWQENNKKIGG